MLNVYDSYGRRKVQPSPSGAEVYVPIVLYDKILSSDGTFDTISIPDDIINVEAIITGRSDVAALSDDIRIVINGDTTITNYHYARHWAGTAHNDSEGNDGRIADIPGATATSGYWGAVKIWIPDVGSSNFHAAHSSIGRMSSTTQRFLLHCSTLWLTSAIITSLYFEPVSGTNFIASSRLQVHGYKVMDIGASVDPRILEGQVFS